MLVENGYYIHDILDDDGLPSRTGTLLTASSHIITAVIGAGVLSLGWALAQLGWIAGPIAIIVIAAITLFCSRLLADCYRSPDPVTGIRNYTYMEAVRNNLGEFQCKICGSAQYGFLVVAAVGYSITSAISMAAIKRSHCFHTKGHNVECHEPNYPYIIIYAAIQIILSQIPNIHKLSWLSIVAAAMSFAYAFIGLALAMIKIAGGAHATTTLTGVVVGVDVTAQEKVFRVMQSLGNIASAYFYSTVLIEIQDTLKSSPPENKVMKKAATIAVLITTLFYITCGTVGYAAFGNNAPGNFLTGFGVYEPFWLIDIGNACIVIHLLGAYQVFGQPLFGFIENWSRRHWPQSKFITKENIVNIPLYGEYSINFFRLVWRTMYVLVTSLIALVLPFFTEFLGLVGAFSFWPLGVYFPVEMYLAQTKTRIFSTKWILLKLLSLFCFGITVIAAIGSIAGIVENLGKYKLFS